MLATKRCHLAGLLLGVGIGVFAIIQQKYLALLGAVLIGYLFAFLGHFIFEKNKRTTFQNPIYSFLSDFKMCGLLLIGRLK